MDQPTHTISYHGALFRHEDALWTAGGEDEAEPPVEDNISEASTAVMDSMTQEVAVLMEMTEQELLYEPEEEIELT